MPADFCLLRQFSVLTGIEKGGYDFVIYGVFTCPHFAILADTGDVSASGLQFCTMHIRITI